MKDKLSFEEQKEIAELVRQECIKRALEAYEEASVSGLCCEGAWEFAIDTIRNVKIEVVLKKALC